jgi:hypothetical protein
MEKHQLVSLCILNLHISITVLMFVYALHHLAQNAPPTTALRRVLCSLTYIKKVFHC